MHTPHEYRANEEVDIGTTASGNSIDASLVDEQCATREKPETYCDVCQKRRPTTRSFVTGIETFACDECSGTFEPCGHCGGETMDECNFRCPIFDGELIEPCHGEAP